MLSAAVPCFTTTLDIARFIFPPVHDSQYVLHPPTVPLNACSIMVSSSPMYRTQTTSRTLWILRSDRFHDRRCYRCCSYLLLDLGLGRSHKAMEPNGTCTICDFVRHPLLKSARRIGSNQHRPHLGQLYGLRGGKSRPQSQLRIL